MWRDYLPYLRYSMPAIQNLLYLTICVVALTICVVALTIVALTICVVAMIIHVALFVS
jgi:hypothetical protein